MTSQIVTQCFIGGKKEKCRSCGSEATRLLQEKHPNGTAEPLGCFCEECHLAMTGESAPK